MALFTLSFLITLDKKRAHTNQNNKNVISVKRIWFDNLYRNKIKELLITLDNYI